MVYASFLFLILASFCNAVMDTCAHHYYKSVFSKHNPYFWNADISWVNKYINRDSSLGRKKIYKNINYPVQFTDSWHLFKMLMIIFITLSIVTFDCSVILNYKYYLLYICIYGCLWNCTFSLFYNKILK